MLFMRAFMNLSTRSAMWNDVFNIWRAQPLTIQAEVMQRMKTNPEKYAELITEITKLRMK